MRQDGDMPEEAQGNRARQHAIWLIVLLALFIFRVSAQLLQWTFPVSWLPSFATWHSATLSYPVLVGTQIVIIVTAVWLIRGLLRNAIVPKPVVGRVLSW